MAGCVCIFKISDGLVCDLKLGGGFYDFVWVNGIVEFHIRNKVEILLHAVF